MKANAPKKTTEIIVDAIMYGLSSDARRDIHARLKTCLASRVPALSSALGYQTCHSFEVDHKERKCVLECVEQLAKDYPKMRIRVVKVSVIRGFDGKRPCKRPSSA